jgi:hypothetical protein
MTNFHTVTPGSQKGNNETNINGKNEIPSSETSDYRKRQTSPSGTRIPGMVTSPGNDLDLTQTQNTGKPIVGFLVSISRCEEGEFWVLHQGQNLIGSGENCNLILPEASVSEEHAVLTVHRNPSDENRLNVGIMDKASSNGTFVNGTYIGFNPCQCKNSDLLKIGNYELLLMLFDAVDSRLKKAENFVLKNDFDYSDPGNYSDGTRY